MEDVVNECEKEEQEERKRKELECQALPHPDKIFKVANINKQSTKET